MPSLSGAIRGNSGGSQYASTNIESHDGDYDAVYCGMSEPFEEIDQQNDCKLCEGKGTMPRGADCFACHGSGKKTTKKVWLRYIFENKAREQEVVTFNLYDGGKGGKATTLYLRLRALSGLNDISEIEAWHDALPTEPRVPCRVGVGWNDKADRRVIQLVRKRNPASATPTDRQRDTRQTPPPAGRHTQARAAEQTQDNEPWKTAAKQHAGKPAPRDARNGYQPAQQDAPEEDWAATVSDEDISF